MPEVVPDTRPTFGRLQDRRQQNQGGHFSETDPHCTPGLRWNDPRRDGAQRSCEMARPKGFEPLAFAFGAI